MLHNMHFDRDTTVVITKINNLSEVALTNYCHKFGKILRCLVKSANQTRTKEAYALIKFAEPSSVSSVLSNRNHTINGTHVVMRSYHQDGSQPNVPPLMSQNPNTSAKIVHEQLVQENQSLKQEINTLKQTLVETQVYSRTAYDTFQALREKFDAERELTTKLQSDYDAMVQSYETRLKQAKETSTNNTNIVKEEPMDCVQKKINTDNYLIEIQVMKERLDQAQIELGKCQTENAILNAKLQSRDQQFDQRYKELNGKYSRLKKQHEHVFSCIDEFHTKIYPDKSIKTETVLKDNNADNDDVIEIVMQVDPQVS